MHEDDKQTPRVTIVSASTGGGHDGVARALADLLGGRVDVVDFYGGGALAGLPYLSRIRYHVAFLWRLFLVLTDRPGVVRLLAWLLRPFALRHLRRRIRWTPEVLVAVHFGAGHALEKLAATMSPRPRTAIVITDYEPHWCWFGRADVIVVPGETAARRALQAGYAPEQIVRVDLLPSRGAQPCPAGHAEQLRVVAVAGADGTSGDRLGAVLTALARGPHAARFAVEVVCGHNRSLRRTIDALADSLAPLRVTTSGFVLDLPDRLACADVALLRASPQTMTEALRAGTPVVAFDWHVHEARNVNLLRRHGCGVATRKPVAAARCLESLLVRERELAALREAARALAARAPGPELARQLLDAPHREAA